jgi:phage-related protein (TIGR01555 family)
MSKNRQRRAQVAKVQAQAVAGSGKRFMVGDSFANFEARVGIGTNNQSSAGGYGFDFISRNRVQMEAMYRSSWIVGAVVDCIAEDMTRAGIDLNTSLKPEQQTKILAAFERMHLWDRLCDNTKWARLYGGSIAVMLIDGQKMDTPLNLDSIGKGQFKGLLVLDRWLVQPTLNLLIQEYGPDMGMPEFYDVVADSMALKRQRIHHSRVIRVDGVDLPYWQKIAENLWGQSVIERLFDRLLAFDSTTQGAAQLVYKAHLRTVKVKGLREIIAMGGPAMDALTKNIDMIRRFQTNEGLTLLDSEDEFDAHQYTFAGLDDVLLQFGQQLSGAAETPLTRLFGQSPTGLNSDGGGEMKQYHEGVASKQERRLRPGVTKLLDVVCRSELGIAPPDDFGFEFNSLEQMSDTEKADINQKTTAAVLDAYDAGLISQKTALQELKQSSEVTGNWTNITDDLINEAEDALPDVTETPPDDGSTQEPGEGAKPESGDPVRRAA